MNWLLSLLVGFLSGIAGLVVAGGVTSVCSGWLNVSNREGAVGYLIVFVALCGGILGFVLGLGLSRWVASLPDPSFLKALAISFGAVFSLGGIALLLGWLSADFAPQLDGRSLQLAIEIRCPEGFLLPTEFDEYGAYACVSIPGSRDYQQRAKLDLDSVHQDAGRSIVKATVPLDTSAPRKLMEVRFSKEVQLTFDLPLQSHPNRKDMAWSQWIDSSRIAGKPEPLPHEKFNLRYKVQLVEPPLPEPDPEEIREREFAGLDSNSPLEQWLPYLFETPRDEWTPLVLQQIEERQKDLARIIRSTNAKSREYALRATIYPTKPAPEVIEAVLAEGREIASEIPKLSQLSTADPLFDPQSQDFNMRFRNWKEAWWGLSQRLGLDTQPPVQEIHELAKKYAGTTAIDEIEEDARSLLELLNQSTVDKNRR